MHFHMLQGIFHVRSAFHKSARIYFVEKSTSEEVLFWRCHPDLNWGIKVLQTLALPLGYGTIYDKRRFLRVFCIFGAEDEIRTRDVHLGKVTLYH